MSLLDSMLKSIEETEKNRPKLTEEEKRKLFCQIGNILIEAFEKDFRSTDKLIRKYL